MPILVAQVTKKEIEKAGDWILNVQCIRGRFWNTSEEGIDLFQRLKFPSLDLNSLGVFVAGKWTWRVNQVSIDKCVCWVHGSRCLYLLMQSEPCPVQAPFFVITHYDAWLKFSSRLTWRTNRSRADETVEVNTESRTFNCPSWMIDHDGFSLTLRVLVEYFKLASRPCWALHHLRHWASRVLVRDSIQVARDISVWWLLQWLSDVAHSMA